MKMQYVCNNCGHTQAKWAGQCDGCGEWNTLEESAAPAKGNAGLGGTGRRTVDAPPAKVQKLLSHELENMPRDPTGSFELDRVLGGGIVPGSLVILSASPGAGKALALDTPIPTPHGWSTMGELQVGDQVFDEGGNPCTIVAATEIMHDRPVYEVRFSDGTTIVADADHQWEVITRANRESKCMQRKVPRGLQERKDGRWLAQVGKREETGIERVHYLGIFDTQEEAVAVATAKRFELRIPEYSVKNQPTICTTEQMKDTLYDADHLRYAITNAHPLQLPKKDLPIDPYTLGAWLGDGNSNDSRITNDDADSEILDNIRAGGHEIKKQSAKMRSNIIGLSPLLRNLGILSNKHIPAEYLRASESQRRSLLAGLLDTDGGCRKNKSSAMFYNSNRRLIDDVYELIVSLGYKAIINQKEAKLYGKPCGLTWQITFSAWDRSPFRLERKTAYWNTSARAQPRAQRRFITDIQPIESVPVRCIQVDSSSHLYLAGKNMIPTHNSTLASTVIDHFAGQGKKTLYVAGEESGAQIRLRVQRMGLQNGDSIDITNSIELNSLASLMRSGYDFAVVDSIQTMYDEGMSSASGTPSVLKQVAHVLLQVAKESGVSILLIGHVTKDGNLAGPRHVEHMVDVVLHMDGERSEDIRVLRAMKNRFGATDEIGIFQMSADGLKDISDPSAILISEHAEPVPGSVICPTLEGTRPIFVEVQALAQPVAFHNAPPVRRPRGIDKARLDMLLAVLQRHAGLQLSLGSKDIYVNISGGFKIEEPAVDLAICLAVASAVTGQPVKKNTAIWGEVSLLGEVRPSPGDKKRRTEVERLGLTPYAPQSKAVPLSKMIRGGLDQTAVRGDLREEAKPGVASVSLPELPEEA